MSTTSNPPEYECRHCGGPREAGTAFCSPTCRYRHRGAGLLDKLASDPDLCATCFRATVHPGPREDGGRFYRKPTAIDVITADTAGDHTDPIYRPTRGCQCGTTDTSETHGLLQSADAARRANALWRALNRLADKGAINGAPDAEAFRAGYDEHPTDWAYLAGRAVYGGADA